MRRWLIEKLGGYATAEQAIVAKGGFLTIEDAIKALRDKSVEERSVILTMAVKKLFNTIGADDILRPVDGNQWMFAGKLLSKGQIDILIAEAAMLEKSQLWKVLKQDILYQTNKKMFVLAQNEMHVITAKFWLYTFDTMATRLKSIAAASPLFNNQK